MKKPYTYKLRVYRSEYGWQDVGAWGTKKQLHSIGKWGYSDRETYKKFKVVPLSKRGAERINKRERMEKERIRKANEKFMEDWRNR